VESIANRILIIRGQRVMLDVDIASLYGVPTKRLNEQVRRNIERFPNDLMFKLNSEEWAALMWSQIATTSQRRRRLDQLPYAFTEHGCLMLANILRSRLAVQISLLVIRAFVRLRTVLAANKDLAARVDELGRELGLQGRKLSTHERTILKLLQDIRRLTRFPDHKTRPIGFTANLDADSS
jgi:phage regulator Rha-like protein